jgi:hypothetical protein
LISFWDGRTTLARHSSKRFELRTLPEIQGGVVHQTAGGDNPEATARYHVGPNHVSATGCPGMLYHFFIQQDGQVWWANDLERVTWSQGGRGSPVLGLDPNRNFLSIVLGGNFVGPGHPTGTSGPPFAQVHALFVLWGHLTGVNKADLPAALFDLAPCPAEALYGHHNFGKPACPGRALSYLLDGIHSHPHDTGATLSSIRDWQKALLGLGMVIGAAGADGVWGPASSRALQSFQDSEGLEPDGLRGPRTMAALLAALG